jgi:hypothetical protein
VLGVLGVLGVLVYWVLGVLWANGILFSYSSSSSQY